MPKKKPIQYDFRDGILLDKVVYRDTSGQCKKNLLYILCLIITWVWGSAWFALFLYLYINYEEVMFWIFIGAWILLIYSIIIFAIIHIQKSKNKKYLKIEKQITKEKIKKEVSKAKIKREKLREKLNKISEKFDNNIFISKKKIANRDSFSIDSKILLNEDIKSSNAELKTGLKSRNNDKIKNLNEDGINTENRAIKTE